MPAVGPGRRARRRAGKESHRVTVATHASIDPRRNETFVVRLSSVQGGRLGAATHVVTIVDNEPSLAGFIDLPQPGTLFTPFFIGGWALDERATAGTGINIVDLYARPVPDLPGPDIYLGRASTGPRPDVAGVYGAQFLNSGFGLNVSAGALGLGVYDIYAMVHFTENDTWDDLPAVRVTVDSSAVLVVDAPEPTTVKQRFTVAGYALDRAATSGTGIDAVEIVATLLPSGNPTSQGFASLGIQRPAVAQTYGTQFGASGFSKEITGLLAGTYQIQIRAHSTVTGWHTRTRDVTIQPDPRMSLDAPAHGSTLGQPFLVGGWAVDLAAATGTGVSTVHIWAHPLAGGNSVFLGVPAFGPRQDVANAFGAQFLNSGFTIASVGGLPPGQWQIVAYAMSTVTGTFNQAMAATITLPTPNAVVAIEAPADGAVVGQPFHIGGWAIDLASPTTVGIASLHVYAYPWTGAPPIFLGVVPVWAGRPDVAAFYGPQYLNSGWGVNASGLAAGTYSLVAYPISAGNQVVPGAALRVVTVQ